MYMLYSDDIGLIFISEYDVYLYSDDEGLIYKWIMTVYMIEFEKLWKIKRSS